eukprot:m.802611 g.802611  ORF g.802611 m.802611 type:complete len:95 (-) comp59275_c0_seq12:159-443(-)
MGGMVQADSSLTANAASDSAAIENSAEPLKTTEAGEEVERADCRVVVVGSAQQALLLALLPVPPPTPPTPIPSAALLSSLVVVVVAFLHWKSSA